MRRSLITAVVAAALTTLAVPAQARSLSTIMPIPSAGSSTPAAANGTYVPLATPVRVVDTAAGAAHNRRGALHGGHSFAATIAGRAGVPAHGVGTVLISLSAWKATAPGALVAWGAGRRPRTVNLQFAPRVRSTDTAVVALSRGRMHIASTAARGSVEVAVDVLGYFRAGSSSVPGAFHSVRPTRVLDTRRTAAIKPRRTISPAIPGLPSGVGSVALTVTVLKPSGTGALLAARPGSPRPAGATLPFTAGRSASAFTVLPMAGRRITLTNASSRPVHVLVDLTGYFTVGIPESAGMFRPLDDVRITSHAIARNSIRTVDTAGRAGVPLRSIAAVLVTLHARSPTSAGTLQAWRAGAKAARRPVAASFAAGHPAAETLLVPVSTAGRFALRSTARGQTSVQVDVLGYVPANAVPAPDQTASARYLDALTNSSGHIPQNEATMHGYGCSDASQGVQFELLDVGAQTVTKPLSPGNPGVALALSGTPNRPVRLSYADLTDAIKAYLDGYIACQKGTDLRVAVGTNNDGDWKAYTASDRGRDWAINVIEPLRDYATTNGYPITIAGADDIEAAFASTEAQAGTWEAQYLAHTSAQLIENGDANDCPMQFGQTGKTCAYGWTQEQYYALAHHGTRIEVLPQIFYPTEAVKWANIDATGGGQLIFAGSLTEHDRDRTQLTPSQGRAALYRALATVVTRPHIPAAVDI